MGAPVEESPFVRNKKRVSDVVTLDQFATVESLMSMRVVSLRFQDGHPVCAPIFVSLEGRNYQPTDIEFEEEALRFAMRDGLVRSRGEVFATVAG